MNPDNYGFQEKHQEKVFLPNLPERENKDRLVHDKDLVYDKELFIRKTFEDNPGKGVELLFKLYYRPLCSHAARYVYSRELAEDLVGEVFERFWQKQSYTQISVSYQAYLFTAVRHQAFQYLRAEFSKKPQGSIDQLDLASLSPSPQQMLQYDELYFAIEKTIQSLSAPVQRVFLMSRFEGKKNASIAAELQISVKTVEAHITKSLQLLRKMLHEQTLLTVLAAVLQVLFFNQLG
jgi:RNA polymerase sigma-70 factor (ECF subfamily)